jgi:hypothetical protein
MGLREIAVLLSPEALTISRGEAEGNSVKGTIKMLFLEKPYNNCFIIPPRSIITSVIFTQPKVHDKV